MEQAETSDVIALSDRREWWESIDPSRLSEDARYRVLRYVVEKYGRKKVLEETGLSRVTLWRLLERISPVKPKYVTPLLKLLSQEEFEKLVSARDRLKSIGILREDDTIDYSLALEILATPGVEGPRSCKPINLNNKIPSTNLYSSCIIKSC